MFTRSLHRVARAGRAALRALHRRLVVATKPVGTTVLAGTLADLARGKPELVLDSGAKPPRDKGKVMLAVARGLL